MQPLRPPLPDVVRTVLGRCRFAYLSTMDLDANSSHLSLMRFTYLAGEELSEYCSTNIEYLLVKLNLLLYETHISNFLFSYHVNKHIYKEV